MSSGSSKCADAKTGTHVVRLENLKVDQDSIKRVKKRSMMDLHIKKSLKSITHSW
jgi:hypothetical protein